MNYLAHLYLAERSGTSLTGNFLGDFVKGRPEDRFAGELAVGIRLHRRIDTMTDDHPATRAARRLLPRPYRRYAGILLDMWFDHALARQWPRWHPTPLPDFAAASAARIAATWPRGEAAPFPVEHLERLPGLLCGYREPTGVEDALGRIELRLRRSPRLQAALPVLRRHDDLLARAFDTVFTDLVGFARAEAPRIRAAGTAHQPRATSGA